MQTCISPPTPFSHIPEKEKKKKDIQKYSRLLITSPGNGLERETDGTSVFFTLQAFYMYIFIQLTFSPCYLSARKTKAVHYHLIFYF